ncbi:hypothetical protein Trydic_g5395 [Trypoxylus dichotomus]
MDEVDITQPTLTSEEQYCEDSFKKIITIGDDGKFIVKIPFTDNLAEIGDSREIAERRFFTVEQQFKSNVKLKSLYTNFMNENISLNHDSYQS